MRLPQMYLIRMCIFKICHIVVEGAIQKLIYFNYRAVVLIYLYIINARLR